MDIRKTIDKYLNTSVKNAPSIHKKKSLYLQVAENFKDKLAKYYNVPRDKIVDRIILTSKMYNAGEFDGYEKTVYIKTGYMDTDTLFHEFAHWIQYSIYGETSCWGKKNCSPELVSQHNKIQKEIASLAKKWGVEKDIRDIMIL